MLMGLLMACASTVPEASLEAPWAPDGRSVDQLTAQMLQRYGLRPSGPTKISAYRIGQPTEDGWVVGNLEASRKIGLDFAGLEGTNVHRRETPVVGNLGPQHECVGCSKGGRVHVLVAGGRMVGAWLSDEVTVPGIYALSEVGMWCGDDEC